MTKTDKERKIEADDEVEKRRYKNRKERRRVLKNIRHNKTH